jgi:AAA15 family ATPase/GTPase
MIERVEIDNFRCFETLYVDGLKRINVIVGKNSSGKSAFLEALFLSSSSNGPNIAFQMRAIRRVGGQIQAIGDVQSYRGIWEDLFYNFDTAKKVHISIRGNAGDQRQLWISIKDNLQQNIPYGKDLDGTSGYPQVSFAWRRGGGKEIVVKPRVTNTGLELGTFVLDHFPMIWFHPAAADAAEVTARRYSELSKRFESQPIIDALKAEFDFIQDISIEFFSSIPMVFATVVGKSQKLPLGLVSDGVNRLFTILIGIAYYAGGVVLIDQLEDGLFFERFPSVWKLLHSMATKYRTQLFISSHSRECLSAVGLTLSNNQDDFCLLRSERQDSKCIVDRFNADTLLAALEEGVEFR